MQPQRTHRGFWWTFGLTVICTLAATSVQALIIVTPKPDQPNNSPALTLSREVVDAHLTDRAADVTVTFTYHNNSNAILEGTYLFPLPPEAAVDKFSLEVDGEEIDAELLDVEQARREYEAIVRQIKDPALLEYVDRQLLRARIFPIQPHSDATIRLYYTHPLVADFGTTDFAFPFGIERWAQNSELELSITVETQGALKSVSSPTHDVVIDRKGDHRATITNSDGQFLQDDLHVLCTFDTRDLSAQFLTTVDGDGNQFFMGIISPGEDPDADILPKDVVFCFDRSGSMQGEKIVQARAALEFCLGRLNPDDRFGLLTFNGRSTHYATDLVVASDLNVESAQEFVEDIDADGGTNINEAMQHAMHMFETNDRPKYLVFLTDGRPTVGVRDPNAIRDYATKANTTGARVFTFGVGKDLNAALLNDLADEGRGIASYVEPGEDVELRVSNFFRRISRPVLSDCRFEVAGDTKVFDVYPDALPDVFAGTEIMIFGRFEGSGPVTTRLQGTRAGTQVNHSFNPEFEPVEGRYDFIPKLWAGRRIGFLLEALRRNGETPEVKEEVVRLSKKYGIMTPYTAFLAAPEEVRMADRRRVDPSGAVPLPRSQTGVVGLQVAPSTNDRAMSAEKVKEAPNVSALTDRYYIRGGRASAAEADEDQSIVTRLAEGHQFTLKDGYWTDWSVMTSGVSPADTVHVKPYSDAYFRLSQNTEIARILTVGQPLKFMWRNALIIIDDLGSESWNKAWNRML